MSIEKYGTIGYSLPPNQASDYAARAINILMDVQHSAPRTLPVFLAANSVLTLSGVRAYDAYHEFYGFYAEDEEQAAADTLLSHGVYLMPSGHESSASDGGRLMFELLNHGGLESLAGNYHMPGGEAWPTVKSDAYTPEGFAHWSEMTENWLTALMLDNTLPAGWAEDELIAHDLRFMMLLGYPGKAVESAVWLNLEEQSNAGELPESDSVLQARIKHHDAYFAAWPVYQYAAELRHEPEIQAHEQLWSEILDIVYQSEWHHQLQDDVGFREVVQHIEQLESLD